MKKSTFCVFIIFLLLSSCQRSYSLPTTGNYQSGMESFDRAFVQLIEKWEIPGGALAIIQNGQILLSRGYGYTNVKEGELVQPNSLFRIASISKPITAVAILKLVEADKLSLDTPAFQLLADLLPPEGKQIDPRISNITIEHLLVHSGGWNSAISFDPMFMCHEIAQEMGTPAPADCTTIIRFMLGQPLDFDPGSQYAYSNFGYCVLGKIIERVSGLPYDDYVQQFILMPAGIENMYLGHTRQSDRLEGEVYYYDYNRAPLAMSVFSTDTTPVPWPYGGFFLEAMDAHGGWVASAIDLARFASVLETTNPAAVLNPDSLSRMLSRPQPPLWEGETSWYAFGWRVRPTANDANWWHTGSLPGTSAILYRTSDGLIWAALFNTRPNTPGDEFFVDVITVMGQAAAKNTILWVSGAVLFCLIGIGFIIFVKIWKRKKAIRK
jgi:N-acyl-D-amino-acid deacylase